MQQNTRVHGNGYIQCDLGPNTRFNVWVPGLPKQAIPSPIHNHTFSFESLVLKGCLMNVTYRLGNGSKYRVYRAETHHGEDTRLALFKHDTVDAIETERRAIPAGQSYYFPFGLFHEAIPMVYPTVTLFRKIDTNAYPDPLVLVPADQQPDNGFDRYQISEDELDLLVMEALKSA